MRRHFVGQQFTNDHGCHFHIIAMYYDENNDMKYVLGLKYSEDWRVYEYHWGFHITFNLTECTDSTPLSTFIQLVQHSVVHHVRLK